MKLCKAQEDLMKSIESFLKKFNRISFGKTPKVLLQAWDNFFEVKHAQSEEVQELLSKLVQDVKIISDELSEYINTPAWNRPLVYCDDDDDEDYTIAITPVDRINDEVLEGIHSIPPGIDSFDAESDLVESVLNRDISIDSSPKIDSLSNEFDRCLLYDKSLSFELRKLLQAKSNANESLPSISLSPVADSDSLMSDDVDSVDDDTSISRPEFESFYVDYPNSGNSTIDVVEDIPVDMPNVLPTHPILEQDFIPTSEFFAYVVWIFLPFLAYPVITALSLLPVGMKKTP
ncbi:hypothetical protein Tco_1030173 [Tanacetum coccineum]|uniref:Uncharacterized protein n=1 Tax=Tanacetum coccineum TaxID=301880 RepID=A0ABQ5G7C0_9ASTR